MNDKEFRLWQWFSASVQCQNDCVSHQSNAEKGNHGAPQHKSCRPVYSIRNLEPHSMFNPEVEYTRDEDSLKSAQTMGFGLLQ